MKVCFCGLGSIGKRHLYHLCAILRESGLGAEVHALRNTDRIMEQGILSLLSKQVMDERQLDSDYDMVFVTNPTHLHYGTIKKMTARTKHMFIEKPVFDGMEYQISDLGLCRDGVYYVAGPLRYSGVIRRLKEIIANEKVYSIRVICSSYLPDWRPNTDYRQNYSARKAQGGGVALDLIHEWDYITHLFGKPQKVCCIRGKHSHLEIDSDDVAVYIADYKDMTAEVHLDYFGRVPKREIEIYTENGTIIGDLIKNRISFTDTREQIQFHEEKDDIYKREMKFFLDQVLKRQPFDNVADCYSILKIALGEEPK